MATIRSAVAMLLLLAASAATAQALPVVELTAGFHRIEAEVAHTQRGRMQGLMGRRGMAKQRGMLFVFDTPGKHCMWMKNTFIPLAVAFLDDNGRIVNIEAMQPKTENNHCAAQPVRYALEMNLGWFRQRGLGPGTTINGIARAPKAQ
jgi:uncharacterized membrane protein (UPF0127 family)